MDSATSAKRIVDVCGIKCGSDTLFLIAGPCVIENEHLTLTTAAKIRTISERLGIPAIFKSSFLKDIEVQWSTLMGLAWTRVCGCCRRSGKKQACRYSQ